MFFILTISYKIKKTNKKIEKIKEYMLKKYVTFSNIENTWGDMILGMYNHVKTDNCYEDIYILKYVGDNFISNIYYMLCYFQLVVLLRLLYCQFTLIWYKAFSKDLSKYMLCINNSMSLFYNLPFNRSKCVSSNHNINIIWFAEFSKVLICSSNIINSFHNPEKIYSNKINVHICYNVICCIFIVLTLINILSLFYNMPFVRSKYVSSVVKIHICFVVKIRNDYTIFHYVQVNCHNILTKTEDSMAFIVNIFNNQTTNQILISLTVEVMLSLLSMKESEQVYSRTTLLLINHVIK